MIFRVSRHSATTHLRQFIAASALCALALLPVSAAYADDTSITLSNIRAIRISDSVVSLSFLSDQEAIGSVVYTTADQTTYTLSDSAPQKDHLFTVDSLEPMHPYSFKMTATAGSLGSNTYVVLISPDGIGTLGQSIVPGTQVVAPDGSLVASTLSAPTTANPHTTLSPWLFAAFAAVAGLVMAGNRIIEKVRAPK